MTQVQTCQGAPTLASLLPIEVFYFTSLMAFIFFLFFASFIYRRTHSPIIGRLSSVSMLLVALYIFAGLLLYDISDPGRFAVITRLEWVGASMALAFWVHVAALLKAEQNSPEGVQLNSGQLAAVIFAYGGGVAFLLVGSLLPSSLAAPLFDYQNIAAGPWPHCLWHPFHVPIGPLYSVFVVYMLVALGFSLHQWYGGVAASHRRARDAGSEHESQAALASRSNYVQLLVATLILLVGGSLLVASEHAILGLPQAVGQFFLMAGGLLAGLAVTYRGAHAGNPNVMSDFFRATASIALLVTGIMVIVYVGEGGQVRMSTLLSLATIGVLFFTHIELWWRFIDNLLLGPQAAEERATLRSALEESAADHDLIRTQVVYQRWSPETQRVFLDLGRGHGRGTIAKAHGIHVSTVDFHIRRIKDTLETNRLEEVRALAHNFQLNMRTSGKSGEAPRAAPSTAPPEPAEMTGDLV